ncbi:MAG: TRAP transporter small permease subunit [Rhodospirillales bacterium]|nr:TRAP transporter small permease subunit [Rhodospirillales bacterium]
MSTVQSLAKLIDAFNERVGKYVAWLALIMVLIQFMVVVMRYIFGIGSIMMQESVVYMHAILFMAGAGYTLLHDGHVRVDIFYRDLSIKKKALINMFGVIFFLAPVSILLWVSSWSYVRNSWKVLEGSKETSGIQAVFLLKSIILVFVVLILLQGISIVLNSLLTLRGVNRKTPQHLNHQPEL